MLISYIFSVIYFVQSADIAKPCVHVRSLLECLNKTNKPGDLIPVDTIFDIQGLYILFQFWKKVRVMSDTIFT